MGFKWFVLFARFGRVDFGVVPEGVEHLARWFWNWERRPAARRRRAEKSEADAVAFAWTRLKFQADEKQAEVLRSTNGRGILNCSRQWGKSTVAAAKAIHRAYTQPDALVLVASPSERQSGEFLQKAEVMMRRAEMPVKGDGFNKLSPAFPNGSRIVGLPGVEGTVRGFSAVSLMIIDEASRVADEMYEALRPMLAVGAGDLWMMSTPKGRRGFFYETWEYGGKDWTRVKAPATECARIPAKFLEEEIALYGEDVFRREFLCEFLDDGSEVFDRKLLEDAIDDDTKQLEL